MGLTIKEVNKGHVAVVGIIQADRDNRYVLASSARIKLAGGLRKTKPVWDDFVDERNALVKKYGVKNAAGVVSVEESADNRPAYNAEVKALEETETDVDKFPQITADELFGKEGEKQNQVPIDVVTDLLECGILKE